VRSQLFLSYASSTGPIGPTRVVVGFRRGGRDLFCGALCLRVRLTRVVRFVVRVSYGACRPHACRCGIPQRRERPLLGCALPEARRPHARCQVVWLRLWSPSTTRVRSQLFLIILKEYCRAQSSSLCVARVSPGARRPNACRSMGFDRKGGMLLY
jgi:hypothetical protein